MKIQWVSVLFLALFSSTVFASEQTVEFDLKKSSFKWSASKKVGDGHSGNIFLKSATGKVKDGKIVGGEFVMDMASFTVMDLTGDWKKKFMDHVKSGDFFEVEKYPTAKLVVEKQINDNTLQAQMTIKDKTLPVVVRFAKNGSLYLGTLKFDRTKFGITYGSANFFKLAADKVIKDEIILQFKVSEKAEDKKAAPTSKAG
ncbi:MAG: YceI family protein [Pseudobdellovibrionaceae bacterium]|nr:YceI family protein [Bdellovibrionales bacterium]USN46100.1 MAG: YceI family protein [Pseudobdellovibrionaceae bacterium]